MKLSKEGEAVFIPCLEQPERVTLKCNDFYLCCLSRRGKMSTRKLARGKNDEFQLIQPVKNGIFVIVNYKIDQALSLVNNSNGEKEIRCVPSKNIFHCKKEEKKDADIEAEYGNNDGARKSYPAAPSSFEVYKSLSLDAHSWCITRVDFGRFCLKNLATGEFLGIDCLGNTMLVSDISTVPESFYLWTIELTTGEVCFIENQEFHSRLRCDVAGRLTASSNSGISEVFRFVRTGKGNMRITSEVHKNQGVACDVTGNIKMLPYDDVEEKDWCDQWILKKCDDGKGIMIRNKRFGRFLCITRKNKGLSLTTYHPFDKVFEVEPQFSSMNRRRNSSADAQANFLRQAIDKKTPNYKRWSWPISSVHKIADEKESSEEKEYLTKMHSVPPDVSIKWDLQPAHQQHFLLSPSDTNDDIYIDGTFKLNLIRTMDNIVAQLYHLETEKYVACCVDGNITQVQSAKDQTTEWIMESTTVSGSVFRSKLHNFYLSRVDVFIPQCESKMEEEKEEVKNEATADSSTFHLIGFATANESSHREKWRLSPCLPSDLTQGEHIVKEIVDDFTAGDKKILRAIGRTATVNAAVMVTSLTGGSISLATGFLTGGALTANRLGNGIKNEDDKEVVKSLAVYGTATTASIAGQAVTGAIMLGLAGATLPVAGAVAFGVGCASGITAGALSEWGVENVLEEHLSEDNRRKT
jgi:hypothetical protein